MPANSGYESKEYKASLLRSKIEGRYPYISIMRFWQIQKDRRGLPNCLSALSVYILNSMRRIYARHVQRVNQCTKWASNLSPLRQSYVAPLWWAILREPPSPALQTKKAEILRIRITIGRFELLSMGHTQQWHTAHVRRSSNRNVGYVSKKTIGVHRAVKVCAFRNSSQRL